MEAKAIDRAKDIERWIDAHRKMFEAALAAPHGTEKDFTSTLNPLDGKPFDYTPRPQSYELSSHVLFHGKTTKLIVGPHDAAP
jgi:hypothetical protein